jgi:hypothetical protein
MAAGIQEEKSSLGSNSQTAAMRCAYNTYPDNSIRQHMYESNIDDDNHSSCYTYARNEFESPSSLS